MTGDLAAIASADLLFKSPVFWWTNR